MSSKRSIGRKLLDVAICILLIAVIAVAVFPIFATSKKSGPRPITSKTKQLALGILMYASDFDEKPPFIHPFEFGTDPLESYLRYPAVHEIPYPPHPKVHKPGTTDFRFQYVLNRKTTRKGAAVRLVLGPFPAIEHPDVKITLTGDMIKSDGNEMTSAAFADGHVKNFEKSKLGAALPPFADFPNPFSLEEMLYIVPDDKTETAFWSVPYEAIDVAAKVRRK